MDVYLYVSARVYVLSGVLNVVVASTIVVF
jgi:hypothetical protein